MSFLRNILKPAEHIQEIEDPKRVKKEYRYWRYRIFYSMFTGYIFFYFTRKSLTFVAPAVMIDLGFDKAQFGILGSILYITYGLSKFASGVMSDQSNPRYFMAFGLIITGLTNIFFGFSSSLIFFALLWGLNGWFQGWGWPPCARLLTHWYSRSERGAWWSMWSTSHNVGGFLIPIVMGVCAQYFGWRYAMFVPGLICVGMGFFLINRLRDTPQSLGLPTVEEYRKDYPETEKKREKKEKELTTREILFDYVLNNKWVWMLAFASFFVYVVRMAINDWSAVYLVEIKKYSMIKANICASLFEAGGLFGMLIAGWFSDKLHGGRRGPMNMLFSVGLVGAISCFWWFPAAGAWADSGILFMVGFFLFGPQMLIGLAAAELSHKKAAGTASGFTGWFAYFGAAATGYPLGKIIENLGWSNFFIILSGCSAVAMFLFLPMWNARGGSKQDDDDDALPLDSDQAIEPEAT